MTPLNQHHRKTLGYIIDAEQLAAEEPDFGDNLPLHRVFMNTHSLVTQHDSLVFNRTCVCKSTASYLVLFDFHEYTHQSLPLQTPTSYARVRSSTY